VAPAADWTQFRQQILAELAAEPIEDGYTHPCETVIEDALHAHGDDAQRWIEVFIAQQDGSSTSAVIVCLGRLRSPGSCVGGWPC